MKLNLIILVVIIFLTSLSIFNTVNKNYKHSMIINTKELGNMGERSFFNTIKNKKDLFKNVKVKFNVLNLVELTKLKKDKSPDEQLKKIEDYFKLNNLEYQIIKINKFKNILYILFYLIVAIIIIRAINKKN